MTPNSPAPIMRAAVVARNVEDTFRIFTEQIGAWWPLPTHGIFGARAGGLHFTGGELVEFAADGARAVWGEVLLWEPPRRIALTWHPGADTGDGSSRVEVTFEEEGDSTRVIIEHRGWEAFGDRAGARRRGYVGPNAWGLVLDHFADTTEPRAEGLDLESLAAAYEEFFTVAGQGGFGPAPDGEWNAEQVLAHVALSDIALVAVTHALLDGRPAHLENQSCQDPAHLRAWIARYAELPALIAAGRAQAAQVLAVLARLTPEQRATEVHCHLTHDAQVVVDAPRPWEAMAAVGQAQVHLPAHIGQLRDLVR